MKGSMKCHLSLERVLPIPCDLKRRSASSATWDQDFCYLNISHFLFEHAYDRTDKMTCAPSKDSDQPV